MLFQGRRVYLMLGRIIRMLLIAAAVIFLLPANAAAEEDLTAGGAKGAVVLEAASGRVLFAVNPDEELAMASTTKIMTAIIALEQPELDTYFEVDPDAIIVEGSSMGLVKGDKVTLRGLVWGMLMVSGNDAAYASAAHISGSVEKFCVLMNEKAREIGMTHTVFDNPAGLDTGDHHSTARDMALLARYAMANDTFASMVREKSASVSYGNPPFHRWLGNHNKLLWRNENCIGIKTGFTKKAGRCLVSAAERDGLRLIAVTLGCPNDFNIHDQLFDECFERLSLSTCRIC
jgi:D-alanyl-D-alanine carboxypeptidase/D-alanyl-D-alanine carboxypeptidase (penicillin-binding protein 5/6)